MACAILKLRHVGSSVVVHGMQALEQSCGVAGLAMQAQQLWCAGLLALRHVASSSPTRVKPHPLQWKADS